MASITDIAKAKAFALWVESQIGSSPEVYIGPEFVEVRFTETQRNALIRWLDKQLWGVFEQKEDSPVKINFGSVLFPWGLRYVIPAALLIFAAGYASKGFQGLRARFS